VQSGGKLSGSVTVSGATTLAGILSPGTTTNLGVISASGAMTLASTSTNNFRLSKTGGVPTNDVVNLNTSVAYSGTLTVLNVTSDTNTLVLGDKFTLFAPPYPGFAGYSGSFTTLLLPALGAGLSWDISGLTVDGSIAVANQVTLPTFTPPQGGYPGGVSVTISSLTPNATIHYTKDGTDPKTSATAISGPSPLTGVLVPANTNLAIRAYATASGMAASAEADASYLTVASCTWITPNSGSWADTNNWTNDFVGNGRGVTADFSKLALPFAVTVTLDGPRTIGGLLFGDTVNASTWDLEPGTGDPLTLDASNSPVVAVLNQTATVGTALAGTNGLTKTGNGTLVLSGANTFSGTTRLNAGTLSVSSPANLPAASALTLSSNTVLDITASLTLANNVNIPAGQSGTLQLAGAFNSMLTGDFSGVSGNLTLDVSAGNNTGFSPNSANGPAPGSVVNLLGATGAAQVYCNPNNVLAQTFFANTKVVVTATGTGTTHFFLGNISNGRNVQFGALDGGNATTLIDSDNEHTTLTINGVADGNFAGTIADGAGASPQVSLVKAGAATQLLSGTNLYTGTTTVSNGTLLVNGFLTNASAVTVLSNAVLGGTGTLGPVALQGKLAPGGGTVGTLNTGAQTWAPGSVVACKLAGTNDDSLSRDQLVLNGTLDLNALTNGSATLKLISMLTSATPGNLPGFNPASNYVWTVGTATGLSPLDPGILSRITVDATAFSNPHAGSFSLVPNLVATPYALELHYTGSTAQPIAPVLSGRTVLPGGSFRLTFSGPSNQTFKVLATNVLNAPRASWPVLMSGTFGVGGPIPTNFVDSNITTTTNKQRFYIIESP
jgi:autotransporter-associated beta strand protein